MSIFSHFSVGAPIGGNTAEFHELPVQSDHHAISAHINKRLGDVRILFEETLL